MDDKLKEIRWEINESTTIPGMVGNNVFQHGHWLACSSNDLMIPLLSIIDLVSNDKIPLNSYRKFGEILREKGLENVLENEWEFSNCVIITTLRNVSNYIFCEKTLNDYGCQNCLYFKKNLRNILNLGGERMLKRIHTRLERLESFRMKETEGTFLK